MSNPNKLVTQVSNSETKFIGAKLGSQVSMTKKESEGGKPVLSKTKSGKLVLSDEEFHQLKQKRSHSKARSQSANRTKDADEDIIINHKTHHNYKKDPNAKYYFDIDEYFSKDHESNLIIHLNIQENHYYITREQLLALPESLLLCLFPNGVFFDRNGDVIQTLTENDEVYIYNFSNKSFEYIMDTYTEATYDLTNHSMQKFYDTYGDPKRKNNESSSGGFFSHFSSSSTPPLSSTQTVIHLLNENPPIIALREHLDDYVRSEELRVG